jgi:hypothetical protein
MSIRSKQPVAGGITPHCAQQRWQDQTTSAASPTADDTITVWELHKGNIARFRANAALTSQRKQW